MTATLSHKQREALKAWPGWVDQLREDGFRVATNSTRERLQIGTGKDWDPRAAYMYKPPQSIKLRAESGKHFTVTYYKFTDAKPPEQFRQEVFA